MSIETQGHSELEIGSSRSFGLVFAVVFAIIAFYPLINGNTIRVWALAVCLVFLVLAFLAPGILDPLNRLWFKLGLLLAKIINPIVMLLIYVIAILPTGIVLRMLGKDLLLLKFDPSKPSYWIEREPPGPEPDSLKDQF